MSATTKTFYGPNGIRLELDASEIVPDNPGEGTPAMVYCGRYSATYGCAMDTGELTDGGDTYDLSQHQLNYLSAMEDRVNEFLEQPAETEGEGGQRP